MSFEKFGINAGILDSLKKEGFKTPTPIQSRAIPALLAGSDVLGGAETGTGKTAAYTIPILDKLTNIQRKGKNPRALIIVPTRELAAQVGDNVRTYSRFLKLQTVEIFGGVNAGPQIQKLSRGVDIAIATPGRLLDLLNQKRINLNSIEMLVLDEADRMLDMGFIHDIKKIIGCIPKERQTMLFSATFPKEIKLLADKMLNNPEMIQVASSNSTAKTIKQVAYPVDGAKKLKLLCRLIQDENWYQVLVFTKTKHRAQSLSLQLVKKGVSAAAIHGDKSQGARTRALKDFKTGKVQALVATDIAARGIDISKLSHVVNFQLPQHPEDYIHRIGRTGRAGEDGIAVSLVSYEDMPQFRNIEKLLNKKIEKIIMKDFVSEKPEAFENYRENTSQRRSINQGEERNSSRRTPGRSYGRSSERAFSNRSSERSSNGGSGRSYGRSSERSSNGGSERGYGRSSERSSNGGSERGYGRSSERSSNGGSERGYGRSSERSSGAVYRGSKSNSSRLKKKSA